MSLGQIINIQLLMNFLRSKIMRGWSLAYRSINKPNPNSAHTTNTNTKQQLNIQTAPGRLSGEYIEQIRQMTKEEVKKPWFKYFGILLLFSIIPTYYLTYKVIDSDQNNFQQHQRIRMAINTYYFRAAFFSSVMAMIAALRFRNPTMLFIQKTNMNVIPLILPLLGCIIGLCLPTTWSNPLLMTPAFVTEGLLTFLLVTRRSIPIPFLYFKTYCLYYDIFVLVILGFYLRSYHKNQKKMQAYIQ